MSLEVPININSLHMIREEVNTTIARSATDFEAYLAAQDDLSSLKSSAETIAQVGGIFRLVQYPGAALIADEMADLLTQLLERSEDVTAVISDSLIQALTHAYFVLPRYVEYVAGRQSELPILIIPYVNEMRAANRQTLIPEYHFYQATISTVSLAQQIDATPQIPELLRTIKRLRHMYQTGLLKIITEKGSVKGNFLIMSRSVSRICSLLGSHSGNEIWLLAAAVLEAFNDNKLALTLNRKRVLADIEKLFRPILSQGEDALGLSPPAELKKNLLFLLVMSNHSSEAIEAIRQAYSLPVTDVNDEELSRQRELMHGPDMATLYSVIKVLKEELHSAKDILEIASQNTSIEGEDLSNLQSILTRVSDTLSIINLDGPRDTLKKQMQEIEKWSTADISSEQFLAAADDVLYVESALSGLNRGEITAQELNEASALTRKKVIERSHLAEAESLVLEEAQSGIALAKRAITSYVDSNFDSAHIANVAVTLNTVRGGLNILGYKRAAAVLKSCGAFIEDHIKQSDAGGQRHQLLETLADALISLEYYLMEVEVSHTADEKILEVAEESLDALGFAVESCVPA